MKFFPAILLPLAFAGEAQAEVQPAFEGASLAGSIVQTFGALAVVVGLILLFYYISNRLFKGSLAAGSSPKYIRILETKFLAPKKSLLLLEVGGEYLLLSSSGEGIQFIKQIDMLEEIEVLESPVFGRMGTGNLQNKIIDLVSRLPKKNRAGETLRAAGGNAS